MKAYEALINHDYESEKEEQLFQESLSNGEFMAAQLRQYAMIEGALRPNEQWINTPVDVHMENPFYEGEPQPHPESYDEEEEIEYPLYDMDGTYFNPLDEEDDSPF